MRIVFLSNYLTHHQAPFSKIMYELTKGDYCFISTIEMDEERTRMGWRSENEPFVLPYKDDSVRCQKLIDEAEIVIFGSAPYSLLKKRLKQKKLTFAYSERIYKKSCPSWQIPLRAIKYYWKWGRFPSAYLLCASAYTASDYARTRTFLGKTYKWGYFPEVRKYNLEMLFSQKQINQTPSLLWAGRLIDWKHPDDAVELAKRLKEKGYSFSLDIIGNGVMEESLRELIANYELQDCVHMLGAMPPEQVRKHMEQADIYLFTSDRQEGWGAVLNESMNSGCAVVANQAIGSVPYLIEHEKNGFAYQDMTELEEYVELLLRDQKLRTRLGTAAYHTLEKQWNADVAAERVLVLTEELRESGMSMVFEEGPCSRA